MQAPMTVPLSMYEAFCTHWDNSPDERKHLRFGQAFFNWANLHKMSPSPWLDLLYNADDAKARKMLLAVVDHAN